MRISVYERDSGHRTLAAHGAAARRAKVFLDGVELKACITADEELGEVLTFAQDASGRYLLDGDQLRREWRRGKVEIVMPEIETA